jgi:5-methylcytosine-specific restriction endonuclease McrA
MNGKHTVRVEDPHPRSLAALVVLTRAYEKQRLSEWLGFRETLLDAAEARDGKLVCTYCERDDLIREIPEGAFRQPANLATVDHVVPRAKGGPDDESNCVIACYRCNQRKADKSKNDFSL